MKGTFSFAARPVVLAATFTLVACASEPSSSDIEKTLTEQAGALSILGVRAEITDVDKVGCADAGEGRLRCGYKYTAKGNGQTITQEESAVFEKRSDGWVIVRR
jgi:hypothetical protein